MRIAYLTTSFIPSLAANSVQVMKMAQALGRLGHDVTLFAAYGDLDEAPFAFYGVEPCFELVRSKRPKGGKVGAARYLASQVAAVWKTRGVELYYGRAARLLLAAAPLGGRLAYEAHALPRSKARLAVQRALFALPNFWRLVCISDALRTDYLEAFPQLDPARVIVAHDGSDPMDLSEPVAEADWPGRPGALQVGYVGGIYPGRGVETLVALAERMPAVDFQIVGGNVDAVEQWTHSGLPENVHFHGHQAHGSLRHIYPRLDVLVAPYKDRVSVYGGGGDIRRWMSPLKVFEYMSTGRAIVCSTVPVLLEVLRHDDNALLLPGEDLDAWQTALQSLSDQPERRLRLGASALKDFESHYTWQQRAAAVIAPGTDA